MNLLWFLAGSTGLAGALLVAFRATIVRTVPRLGRARRSPTQQISLHLSPRYQRHNRAVAKRLPFPLIRQIMIHYKSNPLFTAAGA